jgi:hypothetical protein
MAATAINRKGYGQVEPNHLSAQKTGQIYAQLPAMVDADTPIAQLEQGQFLKYNYAGGRASLDGDGEWMLVYCEEKLYDPRAQMHKDFVLKASDFTDGKIYPRLFKTNIGDIYTTNTFGAAASGPDANVTSGVSLDVGDVLEVDATTGFLKAAQSFAAASVPAFQVVKVYTMPDCVNPGVKIQRVK